MASTASSGRQTTLAVPPALLIERGRLSEEWPLDFEADVQAINDHQYIRESPLTVNSGCNLADKGFRVKLPNGCHDPCLIPLFQRNLIFEDLFDFFGGERQAEVLLRQPLNVCRGSGPAVVPLVQEVSGNVHVFRSSSLCER